MRCNVFMFCNSGEGSTADKMWNYSSYEGKGSREKKRAWQMFSVSRLITQLASRIIQSTAPSRHPSTATRQNRTTISLLFRLALPLPDLNLVLCIIPNYRIQNS